MTFKHEKEEPFEAAAFREALSKSVESCFEGLPLTAFQADRLVAYGTWLADISRSINLTRILEPQAMAVAHFLDAWQLLPLLEGRSGRVLDAGTGGGVPGIPLAVFRPDLEVVLIDGAAKKIAVVKTCIEMLKLENVRAVHARAEEHLRTRKYEAAVCRAAVKPGAMMEILLHTGPVIKTVIFMEGAKGLETDREIRSQARRAGYRLKHSPSYRLPGMSKDRFLLAYQKRVRPSPDYR